MNTDIVRKLERLLSKREQRHAFLLLAMMVVGAVLEMVGVGAIPAFVALLSDPSRITRYALPREMMSALGADTNTKLALTAAVILLLYFFVKNLFIGSLSFLQARYVSNRQVRLASQLFNAYMHSEYTMHLQRNSAELLRNATNEAMEVVGSVLMPCLSLAMEFLTVGAIVTLLFIAEPFISLVAFVLLGGATALFIRVVRSRLIRYGHETQLYRMKMLQTVSEGLGSLKITRVLGREPHFLQAFRLDSDRFAQANRFRVLMSDLPRLYLEMAAMLGLLAVAAILLAEHRPLGAIIPALSLLAVAVVRLIPSFNRISAAFTQLRYGRFSLEAVYADLVNSNTNADVRHRDTTTIPFVEAIRLRDVSFTYPNAAAPAVRNVNLDIRRGNAVGIVGATGSGKTTLVDIVLGLLRPSSGKVLIDDRDVTQDVRAWQKHIGYVPQDIYLMDESIRNNVAFGIAADEIDDAAVQRAIDAAQLTTFIHSLPDGVNTVVGERGVRLSGGQRQRIGIARALYHDPDVLVFDEATSSLDNETERFVMQAVDHLRGARTIILIAHRMSTVRACDELFLLNEGRLVASGSFESLLKSSGRFQSLVGVE
ncbi:MAG: ABC transporter ATP-binding protein [Gemmatimonadaceae bacterium]